MAFHFKKKESPTKAVRRLCRERLGKALAQLQHYEGLDGVHSVRKEIKKVRATLRLTRKTMDGDAYRKYARTLRAAAKHLTDPRDAHVRPRTLKRLMVHFKTRLPEHAFVAIRKVLRQDCLEEARDFLERDSAATVDRLLRKVNRRMKNLKVEAEGWVAIQSGLKESYHRGREAFRMAAKKASPESFHWWRKHVQDLWHQLRLLCPIQPEKLHATADTLKTLSQRLGDDHDLVILKQFVACRCACKHPVEVKLLNELIELRQKELRSAALALGSRLYVEKPSQFCRRLENYWRVWRSDQNTGN